MWIIDSSAPLPGDGLWTAKRARARNRSNASTHKQYRYYSKVHNVNTARALFGRFFRIHVLRAGHTYKRAFGRGVVGGRSRGYTEREREGVRLMNGVAPVPPEESVASVFDDRLKNDYLRAKAIRGWTKPTITYFILLLSLLRNSKFGRRCAAALVPVARRRRRAAPQPPPAHRPSDQTPGRDCPLCRSPTVHWRARARYYLRRRRRSNIGRPPEAPKAAGIMHRSRTRRDRGADSETFPPRVYLGGNSAGGGGSGA